MEPQYLIGVDIGGTFTDCAVVDKNTGEVIAGKSPTTPHDHGEGFFGAVRAAADGLGLSLEELLSRTQRLAHGTTVATNAIVSRDGARVGLIATKGHGQAIFIADNASRSTGVPIEELLHYPSSYGLRPFVTRADVREIDERVDRDGDVVVRLDEAGVLAAAEDLVASGVESIAVCFLWSFMNATHEQRAVELIAGKLPGIPVCASSAIAAYIGEYPRMATTILNAYISPKMNDYVKRIEGMARDLGLRSTLMFMQADGGLATADEILRRPIDTLQSGPVAGVRATSEYAKLTGEGEVITTDVGGTTLDVSVVTGGLVTPTKMTTLQQHVLMLDQVDVQSVGAGGGSVAWIEPVSHALRVGPQSVGADPGPACYGRGNTLPTVTDADVLLGFLDPETFFGGELPLDRSLATAAVRSVAEPMGMTVEQAAAAIHRVADAKMSDLMRSMTVRQGIDPRKYTVYAFGGGGGTHAAVYSSGLGCRELVVPRADVASVWSALGVAFADLTHSFRQPVLFGEPFDLAAIAEHVDRLERRAAEYVRGIGDLAESIEIRRQAACKYGMQVFEVTADIPTGEVTAESMRRMSEDFEARYAALFGADAGYRQAGVVITALTVEIVGRVTKPRFRGVDVTPRDAAVGKIRRHRDVYWHEHEDRVRTAVWTGPLLEPGDVVVGPAVVEYPHTTVVVRPGMTMQVDGLGSLRIATDKWEAHA